MSTAAEEVWAILREVAQSQKETDRKFQETEKLLQELAQSQRETDRKSREADRKIKQQFKELGQQIGGLGDKFGYFTEGMALPSMERILTDRFGMTTVMPRVRTQCH